MSIEEDDELVLGAVARGVLMAAGLVFVRRATVGRRIISARLDNDELLGALRGLANFRLTQAWNLFPLFV
jgi:hypothetical protein